MVRFGWSAFGMVTILGSKAMVFTTGWHVHSHNLPQNGLRWDDDQPFLAFNPHMLLTKPSSDLETSRPRPARLRLRTIFQVVCSQKRGAIHLGWSLTNGWWKCVDTLKPSETIKKNPDIPGDCSIYFWGMRGMLSPPDQGVQVPTNPPGPAISMRRGPTRIQGF